MKKELLLALKRPVREGVELARGGTLFLDEIGDMPLPFCSQNYSVSLKTKTVQRVGGNEEIGVDFRLICATHQNIQSRVDEGAFRADLFYRINVFPINVPSLAERNVDIPLIANAIIAQLLESNRGKIPQLDDSALSELSRYTWPGNVRELRNVLERAMVMFPEQRVTASHVRDNLLKMKMPQHSEEMDALWEASRDLCGVDITNDAENHHCLTHPTIPIGSATLNK